MALTRFRLSLFVVAAASVAGLSSRCLTFNQADELTTVERAALYKRTMNNLTTVCSDHPDTLRDFCQSQARLALSLPECDAECRQVSAAVLPRATK